jgi:hypothetical protein
MWKASIASVVVLSFLTGGCAFDVVSVRQAPTHFTANSKSKDGFRLLTEVKAKLGTGFPTELHAGTQWTKAGDVTQGAVYRTADQVVKVEASNIQEAWIVVSNETLVGFYMPVEGTFAPLGHPYPLSLDHSSTTQHFS